MLRNRPRTVPTTTTTTTKQANFMADHNHTTSQSPSTRPISSFLGSPRFRAFTTKGLSETTDHHAVIMSPTSTLDSKPFSALRNPILTHNPKNPETVSEENRHSWDKLIDSTRGIGLALIDTLNDDEKIVQNCSKKVLFGSKLRVKIPPLQPSPVGSPMITGRLTVSEMELSEDYTCVISHGPNPRTTHIFDNCIVESYSCVFADNKSSSNFSPNKETSFLSFCHTCSKNLEQKNDIYIYRGDKAFCSNECRNQEMLLDGVVNNNSEFEDTSKTCS